MINILRPSYKSLVDVMVALPLLDQHIDSYRHKEDVIIEVTFEEYLKFIEFVLGKKRYLYNSSEYLKNLVSEYRTNPNRKVFYELYENYVLDVMTACAKELCLADRRGMPATLIKYIPIRPERIYRMEDKVPPIDEDIKREFYRRLNLLSYPLKEHYTHKGNEKIRKYIDMSITLSFAKTKTEFFILI